MRMVSFQACLFTCLFSFSISTPTLGQDPSGNAMRDMRYCEILSVGGTLLRPVISVYNTFPLNTCDDGLWQAITEESAAAELGLSRVILNGPRHFIMDTIAASDTTAEGKQIEVGGIAMIKRAEIKTKLTQMADGPYTERPIDRSTLYGFAAGFPVYLLINPAGDAYVMQSYSLQVDPKLNAESLVGLASRLKLPEGWTFRVALPKELFKAVADGQAIVVRDDLKNTYQKIGKLPPALVLQ